PITIRLRLVPAASRMIFPSLLHRAAILLSVIFLQSKLAKSSRGPHNSMTFFESLLLLLLAAIALLQVARRLSLPYPAMLAGAGVIVALIPGAPTIPNQPSTYLALFMAPALVDAAYDFPPGATRRFLSPLITFAVVAVILTTGVVALIGTTFLGLPVAAAIALGPIVAP